MENYKIKIENKEILICNILMNALDSPKPEGVTIPWMDSRYIIEDKIKDLQFGEKINLNKNEFLFLYSELNQAKFIIQSIDLVNLSKKIKKEIEDFKN